MSHDSQLRMWTWILRFVNVMRFFAWTIFVMTVVTYAFYSREFFASKQFGIIASFWFEAGLIGSLFSMFLWIDNYKHAARMIKNQVLEESRMLRLGYNLLAIYVLEWILEFRSWFGPEFEWTKSSTVLEAPADGAWSFQIESPTLALSEKIPYITPVTEGMATIVLAFVLIYWAKTLTETNRLKSELSEIV